jgi:hypothetical protein
MGNELTQKPGVSNKIEVYKFATGSIAASGSYTTNAICTHGRTGICSVHYAVTGDGTAKIEYLVSADGSTFVEPSSASDVATGKTTGNYVDPFEPVLAPFLKLKVTETGGAHAIVVTMHVCIQ